MYCRVSTITQKLDRQLLGLTDGENSDEYRIYEDKCSGSIPLKDRPAGARLLKDIEEGLVDTVVCWELSRLGRDLISVLEQTREFTEKGIQLIVQKQGIKLLLDDGSPNPIASLLISTMSSIAEMGRLSILEKQREGIEARKRAGLYTGRKRGTTESNFKFLQKPKNKKIAKFLDEDMSVSHIAHIVGCSRNLVMKVKDKRAA